MAQIITDLELCHTLLNGLKASIVTIFYTSLFKDDRTMFMLFLGALAGGIGLLSTFATSLVPAGQARCSFSNVLFLHPRMLLDPMMLCDFFSAMAEFMIRGFAPEED